MLLGIAAPRATSMTGPRTALTYTRVARTGSKTVGSTLAVATVSIAVAPPRARARGKAGSPTPATALLWRRFRRRLTPLWRLVRRASPLSASSRSYSTSLFLRARKSSPCLPRPLPRAYRNAPCSYLLLLPTLSDTGRSLLVSVAGVPQANVRGLGLSLCLLEVLRVLVVRRDRQNLRVALCEQGAIVHLAAPR